MATAFSKTEQEKVAEVLTQIAVDFEGCAEMVMVLHDDDLLELQFESDEYGLGEQSHWIFLWQIMQTRAPEEILHHEIKKSLEEFQAAVHRAGSEHGR